MKKAVIVFLLVTTSFIYGQVGIGTTNPKATLDVQGSYAGKFRDLISSSATSINQIKVDDQIVVLSGILNSIFALPSSSKVGAGTLYTLHNYTTQNQRIRVNATLNESIRFHGAFVTEFILKGGETVDVVRSTINDSEQWFVLTSNIDTSIYANDADLQGDRTVTQGTHKLAFDTKIANGFSVNNETFSVNGSNGRVGIGTSAPFAKLEVRATQNTGDIARITDINGKMVARINSEGNLGINTENSFVNNTLHVRGSTRLEGPIVVGNNSAGTVNNVLTSQGPNATPIWKAIDFPDANSYKLKGVYKTTLRYASISNTQSGYPIGYLPGITVSKPDNYILVLFQSNAYIPNVTAPHNSPAIAFKYQFDLDKTLIEETASEVIAVEQGFTNASRSFSYQFIINNASVGTHFMDAFAYRKNSANGGDKSPLYFNVEFKDNGVHEKLGSLIVFVYEK